MKMVKILALVLLYITYSYAGIPVWRFNTVPNYLPSITVTPISTANIKYTITNQSRKSHTLSMKNITGITQITSTGNCSNPFTLNYQQSCTLNLLVDGSALTESIKGGPIVCENGSELECYQPGPDDILNINFAPVTYYLLTPQSSSNGTISPNTPQSIVSGTNFTFTATPNVDYQVDEWLLDGYPAQRGGTTFILNNIDSNHTIEATFTRLGTLFAGTSVGSLFYSTDNGNTWTQTSATPSTNNAVNGIFVTQSTVYVASADGKVYYSTNTGSSWMQSSTPAGTTSINSVYVIETSFLTTLYIGTQEGKVFSSTNNGTSWNLIGTQPGSGTINSLYIYGSKIYTGSSDGNIYYSTNNGSSFSTINGPINNIPIPVSIHNIFIVNDKLYVNAIQTSTNSSLPVGTSNFENVYYSDSATNSNPTWSLYAWITYTLFVNKDASLMYAGTQNGHVFSLITGEDLGFITRSPITSLYFK